MHGLCRLHSYLLMEFWVKSVSRSAGSGKNFWPVCNEYIKIPKTHYWFFMWCFPLPRPWTLWGKINRTSNYVSKPETELNILTSLSAVQEALQMPSVQSWPSQNKCSLLFIQ